MLQRGNWLTLAVTSTKRSRNHRDQTLVGLCLADFPVGRSGIEVPSPCQWCHCVRGPITGGCLRNWSLTPCQWVAIGTIISTSTTILEYYANGTSGCSTEPYR